CLGRTSNFLARALMEMNARPGRIAESINFGDAPRACCSSSFVWRCNRALVQLAPAQLWHVNAAASVQRETRAPAPQKLLPCLPPAHAVRLSEAEPFAPTAPQSR